MKSLNYYHVLIFALSLIFLIFSQVLNIGEFAVSSVYFVFIFFSLILSFLCRKKSKLSFAIIILLFILMFVCSKNGPDYLSYKLIYENVSASSTFDGIHGETLYLVINKFFSYFLDYDSFRILFLSAFLALMAYSIFKLSPDPAFSFILSVMGLLVYYISAYRQFAVCAITVYSIQLILNKQRKILPVLLSLLSIFIHSAGVVSLIVILALMIKSELKIKNYYVWIILAVFLRVVLSLILKNSFVTPMVENAIGYSEITLFSFGFFSRIAELFLLCYYVKRVRMDAKARKLFLLYYVFTIIYVIIPYEFLMARLLIICRFWVAILVPAISLSEQTTKCGLFLTKTHAVKYELRSLFFVLYLILFVYQLSFQSGYFPYIHMFF